LLLPAPELGLALPLDGPDDAPDLFPGNPGTLLSSRSRVALVSEPCVLDPAEGAGPDSLPGFPVTPGFEVPPVPGAFCALDDGWFV